MPAYAAYFAILMRSNEDYLDYVAFNDINEMWYDKSVEAWQQKLVNTLVRK